MAKPLLLRKLQRRGMQEPLYLHAVHQRFADYSDAEQAAARLHQGQWLWIHAVSLGETRAAAIVLQALRAAQPDVRVLLTHGTATGWEQGRQLLHPGDMQAWLPWDERSAVRRFVRLFRPRLGLLMETEIWPQLLRICRQEQVPVALVNARMSEKSWRQTRRVRGLAMEAYRSLQVVYAQTEEDAQRLRQLQAPEVLVTGNIKFDATPDAGLLQVGRQLREQWQQCEHDEEKAALLASLPVAVLASSREGEELQWLQAMQTVPEQQRAAVQWLVVPRHPQRFDATAQMLEQAGWQVLRRSRHSMKEANALPHQPQTGQKIAWLGDSMGEMPLYYGMADLALLGGSFAELGGQNLIEACACGCPVLLGPHTFNFAEASAQAIEAGAALRCTDMQQAVHDAYRLLGASTGAVKGKKIALEQMKMAALSFSTRHRGATDKLVADMQRRGWLPDSPD